MDKDFEFKAIIFLAGVLIAGAIIYSGNKLSLESKIETCQKVLYERFNEEPTKFQCLGFMSGQEKWKWP